MTAAVEIHGLTKRFDETLATDNLSFTVERGQVAGLLGPNGAGKTTTLRALLGLMKPDAGTALIFGRPFAEHAHPARVVGAVLERAGFHPARSGRQHLRVLTAVAGLPASRADEVLDLVDLGEAADRRVGGYSLGMRQRLALAAALLGDPELLILDEPANGLDPRGIRWLRDFIRAKSGEGRTVVFASHVLSEVVQVVGEVIVVDKGRMLEHVALSELGARAQADVLARTPDPAALADVVRGRGAHIERIEDDLLVVRGISVDDVGYAASEAGIPILGLTAETATLEDFFLTVTGGHHPREVVR